MPKKTLTYKNISDQTLEVIGVGLVGSGETIESHGILRSTKLVLVQNEQEEKKTQTSKAETGSKKKSRKSRGKISE